MRKNLLERFLNKFNKKNTKISYRSSIDIFYKYICSKKNKHYESDEDLISELDFVDVEEYSYSLKLKDAGYRCSTVNHRLECLREYFDFLVKARILEYNLTDTIKKHSENEVREDAKEKYIPTKAEIEKMIRETYREKNDSRNYEYISARNRFYIAFLATTGLRVNEALGIVMSDIEAVDGGYMVNIHKERVKNGIEKRVPIVPGIMKYFEEYKNQRLIFNEKYNSDLLFLSSRGKKILPCSMNRAIERINDDNGIKGNITNHCFRHFLTQQLEKNLVEENLILKILGWKGGNKARNTYAGKANDKKYDRHKLQVCDVLG